MQSLALCQVDDPIASRGNQWRNFESVQVYDVAGRPEPRVKASQCFTKYRWRAESTAGAGGAAIVATQVRQKSTLRDLPRCCVGPNSERAENSAADKIVGGRCWLGLGTGFGETLAARMTCAACIAPLPVWQSCPEPACFSQCIVHFHIQIV